MWRVATACRLCYNLCVTINYQTTRSNRKTISILVKEGEVFVRAPLRCTAAQIEDFVQLKHDWIERKICDYRSRSQNLDAYLRCDRVLLHGVSFDVKVAKSVAIDESARTVYLPPVDKAAQMKKLKSFYTRRAKVELCERLTAVSKKIEMPFASFSLTNARSKWGSCDGKNNIRLNFRLLFFPQSVIDYVIVHELCHTRHHDHSRQFWALVNSIVPNVKDCKRFLKEYNLLIDTFRT